MCSVFVIGGVLCCVVSINLAGSGVRSKVYSVFLTGCCVVLCCVVLCQLILQGRG